jgi:uncharacterized phage-associated protein
MYSAMAVANAFIKRAKEGRLENLTPMKLQKLMYYAQSWQLANHPDDPLFDDFFARWPYGPVVPSLYHAFRKYGARDIRDYEGTVVEEDGRLIRKFWIVAADDTESWNLIDKIIKIYGKYSGSQLSTMTHRQGTAWSSVVADGDVIPNDLLGQCIQKTKGY